MKTLFKMLVLVFILVLMAVAVVPVSAKASRIDFTLYECSNVTGVEKAWISEDGVLHQRGSTMVNTTISTDREEYFGGLVYLVGNSDIRLATFEGHATGKFYTDPTDSIDGSWVGTFSTQISPTGIDGNIVAQGTGEMEGWKMFGHATNTNPLSNCDTMVGYILIP